MKRCAIPGCRTLIESCWKFCAFHEVLNLQPAAAAETPTPTPPGAADQRRPAWWRSTLKATR